MRLIGACCHEQFHRSRGSPVASGAAPAVKMITAAPLVAAIIGTNRDDRTRASRQLACLMLAYPRIVLSEGELLTVNQRLARLVPASQGREQAALLALCAVLTDGLSAEVRSMLRALDEREQERSVGVAVAAHICSLLADGFPISDELLIDLAAMVRSHDAVRVIADLGSNRCRAMNLVLAAVAI